MDLQQIRKEIDRIDGQIVELLEQRMQRCRDVAEFKISTGKQVLDRARELEKIKAVRSLAKSEFNQRAVEDIFVQVMAISRKLQYQLLAKSGLTDPIGFTAVDEIEKQGKTVVYQGVPGAYSNRAMLEYFGENVNNYCVETWDNAMEEVAEGRADYAVLPIENSSAGMVLDVCDLLVKFDNTIVDEYYLKVDHALMGLPEAEIGDIKTIYSHPQGMMQCAKYLDAHRDWQRISQNNTALSAKKVLEQGDRSTAAIASELAAQVHGLKVLESQINDNKDNTTRFLIIASKKIYKKDANRISLSLEIPNSDESGALYRTLSHLIYNELNMTKIESRPIREKAWEYRFFIDIDGNLGDSSVQNALKGMREDVEVLEILGNY